MKIDGMKSDKYGEDAAALQKGRAWRIIRRSFILLLTVLLSVVIFLLGVITVICKGPSPTMRDLFVTTVMETSAAKFLAHMYFSDSEISEIQKRNAVTVLEEITDTTSEFTKPAEDDKKEAIELVEVNGSTYRGKMIIIQDPSRVKVAALSEYGPEAVGKRVEDFVKDEGAVAGVNGGGFVDENGVGKGGLPIGLVISNSKILSGSLDAKSTIVGFDKNDRLVVGTMTGNECIKLGIRDALSFGPTFIVNSKPAQISGTSGGLNPRTLIGQREDGAVLMLVIDGRQANSMGASFADCIEVMQKFGAVNAGNLDGGSSTIMVYEGEVVNTCASLYGSRKLPNAFIVSAEESESSSPSEQP